jgi:hypothetical protein
MDFVKVAEELKESKIQTNKYVGVSDVTIKNYIAKLKFFEKNKVLNDKLPEFIKTTYENLNTRGAYQVAVTGTAKHSKTFAEYIGKEVIDIITKENETVMNEIRGKSGNQTKTEREEENWIELKQLKKLFKEKKEQFSIQDQLLIAMYILMPPARLDFHNVKIVRSSFIDETTKLPEGIKENENFLRIYKKSGRNYTDLNLKEYKTSATYGDYKERLPKPITDLILQLPVTQEYLFQKKAGGAFSSPETYGVYLRSVFNKLTGKNLSVDILRHIYLTDFRKGEKSTEKKQAIAKKMMNSVEQQTEYLRIKK